MKVLTIRRNHVSHYDEQCQSLGEATEVGLKSGWTIIKIWGKGDESLTILQIAL